MAERRKRSAAEPEKKPRNGFAAAKKAMDKKDPVAAKVVGNGSRGATKSAPEPEVDSIEEGNGDKGGRLASPRKRRATIEDATSEFLAKFDSDTIVTTAFAKARKLPCFKYVNLVAFEKNEKIAKKTPPGLLRMRLGNLLRSAFKKYDESKK